MIRCISWSISPIGMVTKVLIAMTDTKVKEKSDDETMITISPVGMTANKVVTLMLKKKLTEKLSSVLKWKK